jgi:ankyrin repeat protein
MNHVEELISLLENGVRGKVELVEDSSNDYFFKYARDGDAEKLKMQMQNISNINKRDVAGGSGRSLLHHAVINGHEDCVDVLLESDLININLKTLLGKDTSLHLAALISNRNIVFKLLQHGANPNSKNSFGSTPLHYATDKKIACLLVTFGGKVTVKDSSKRKPIDYAIGNKTDKKSELIKFLLEAEDEADRQIFKQRLDQSRRKKTEKELMLQKQNDERRAVEKANDEREKMIGYLAWRRHSETHTHTHTQKAI